MDFEQAVRIVLMHEGGLSDIPEDPGGLTKFGISQRAFPKLDIRNLTLDGAKEIYRQHYWDMCRCDKLPSWARLIVFDCAVNQGVARATTFIQRIGKVKVDGIIGPLTIESLSKVDPMEFVYRYKTQRRQAYVKNPNWPVFGKGWIARLDDISYLSYLSASAAIRLS